MNLKSGFLGGLAGHFQIGNIFGGLGDGCQETTSPSCEEAGSSSASPTLKSTSANPATAGGKTGEEEQPNKPTVLIQGRAGNTFAKCDVSRVSETEVLTLRSVIADACPGKSERQILSTINMSPDRNMAPFVAQSGTV